MTKGNLMITRDEVAKVVHDAVAETFSLNEGIGDDSISFKDDLDADSLSMLSLAMILEDEFEAEIEEDQVGNFVTIANVIDYIIDRQDKTPA